MLTGQQITLRALTRDDLPALCAWSNDVEYELACGDRTLRPHTLEGWQRWYDNTIAAPGRKDVDFAIDHDGMLIGTCGLMHLDNPARRAELGIGIGVSGARGLGNGRDAIELVLRYAFRLLNLNRVLLFTNASNERAVRCYRACGFVEEGCLRQHVWSDGSYGDTLIMGILFSEWQARQENP